MHLLTANRSNDRRGSHSAIDERAGETTPASQEPNGLTVKKRVACEEEDEETLNGGTGEAK